MQQICVEEYTQALRQGRREADALKSSGENPNLIVLDQIIPDYSGLSVVDLGIMEIPTERIAGTKSEGRYTAFSRSFYPLLDVHSEFGAKWVALCEAHLGQTGITDPITCYEYLGLFYVAEGNKRVSVMRHFGAPRILASVKRLLPPPSDNPQIQAYYSFLDFYKLTQLYTVQFRRGADYGKLLSLLGCSSTEPWTEEARRTFNSRLHYFVEAVQSVNVKKADILPEEALLLWLDIHPYADLSGLSAAELKKSVAQLWEDIVSSQKEAISIETKIEDASVGAIIARKIFFSPDRLNIAFIQQMEPVSSAWALSHDSGIRYLQEALGDKIAIEKYHNAETPEKAEAAIEQAVEDGAQVVFTLVPQMRRATLKAAVKYPKIFFFNCSVDQPFSSVRSFYGRIHEAKFIAGAIAGAMSTDDRIGYIASYPIYGEPAAINAFALGAQMTNPKAQIVLKWSCVPGSPQAELLADGIRVISNRDVPERSAQFMNFCNYGTYLVDEQKRLVPLASPVWFWGRIYETIVNGILSGAMKHVTDGVAKNYWMGMDTGVIDIELSDRLPAGIRFLAETLHRDIANKTLNPFARIITAQDGTAWDKSADGFTMEELLHMDWLCDNVIGSIPAKEDILPISQKLVEELGIYQKQQEKIQKE